MLRMAFEREVVLNIRHRIEVYEQQRLFDENADEDGIPLETEFSNSYIHLGSRQRSLKIPTYEKVLEEELAFSNFGDHLARFLRDYARVDVHGSDFEGDGFEGDQHNIYWCKVASSLCVIPPCWLTNDRSSLIIRAMLHLIAKKRLFGGRRSSMFHRRGVVRGRGMIRS